MQRRREKGFEGGIVKTRNGTDRTGPKIVLIERHRRLKINLSALTKTSHVTEIFALLFGDG